MRRMTAALLALILAVSLSGCRVRTGLEGGGAPVDSAGGASGGETPDEARYDGALTEWDGDEGDDGATRENPQAERREFDESAPVEAASGTERVLFGPGEGVGESVIDHTADSRGPFLDDGAEDTAKQTVDAEQADELGASDGAEEADSAMTYYTALLRERSASLFECQRLSVYWETAKDHVTVYRTSREHDMILAAGAYDVSGRLLEENLTVDDGWIARKNPGVIVKVVPAGMLGAGVTRAEAEGVLQRLTAREGLRDTDAMKNGRVAVFSEELLQEPRLQTFVMLMIAKTAGAELYADVDLVEAFSALMEEAAGSRPAGTYFLTAGSSAS